MLMVGGGSRIPAVQTVVSQFFDGKGLVKFTNPEECVVLGNKLFFFLLILLPTVIFSYII